ncbi:hypothetical protein NPIL_593941 [Nephila pilipes]|uniref:Uncharacterized protein n=1 Tax=Nephila pilipes TaxID=299642 RepID=A0A8X6U833_NEPPI|nr:hypothetical protein NPIL_593941 [Nephila pilipes]
MKYLSITARHRKENQYFGHISGDLLPQDTNTQDDLQGTVTVPLGGNMDKRIRHAKQVLLNSEIPQLQQRRHVIWYSDYSRSKTFCSTASMRITSEMPSLSL